MGRPTVHVNRRGKRAKSIKGGGGAPGACCVLLASIHVYIVVGSTLAADFVNPIAEGADPWVVRHRGAYYWCQTEGNLGVAIWRSERLTEQGVKRVVWRAPETGPHRAQVWAPELHFLDGRWYVYTAASDGRNENHRSIVLESATDDPLSEYRFKSELYTGDEPDTGRNNRWSIDLTVLEHRGRRYAIWSGWESDADVQHLYIAAMSNPWTISSRRIRLCANDDYPWERVGESPEGRGLHEAPQVLQRGGRDFLIYSCSGSWEPAYKLGMLELQPEGDPLDPAAWSKRSKPIFSSSPEVFGVGHCSFTLSPDGTQDWLVYHAKVDRALGWQRVICVQPFTWTRDGEPSLGSPAAWGVPLASPSGQARQPLDGAVEDSFDGELSRWTYYGHHQLLHQEAGRVHLGMTSPQASNVHRCGEKLVIRDGAWSDFSVRARVCVVDGPQDAGLLFRTTLCGVGYDAQRGYFAGIIPAENRIILGATDGSRWEELARTPHPLSFGQAYDLEVTAEGDRLTVALDGVKVLEHRDGRYPLGTVGLRVVNCHAWFDDIAIRLLPDAGRKD